MERLIASIDKKNREEIRMSAKESKGRRWVDLRVYVSGSPAEKKWPTGKGFEVPEEDWARSREGLVAAERELKGNGWFHE